MFFYLNQVGIEHEHFGNDTVAANKIVQNLLGLGGLSLCIQKTVNVVNHGDASDISRIELRSKLDRQIDQFKLFQVEALIDAWA